MESLSDVLYEGMASVGMSLLCRPWIETPERACDPLISALFRTLVRQLPSGGNLISNFSFALEARKVFTLIHEGGHFLAARILVQGKVNMSLTTPTSGFTTYTPYSFTTLGQWLGKDPSIALITIAGPIFETCAALIGLMASTYFQRTHPMVSGYLRWACHLNFCHQFSYAAESIFSDSSPSNDYTRLQTYGLSPWVPMACFAALFIRA